jgi:hypothetical protein
MTAAELIALALSRQAAAPGAEPFALAAALLLVDVDVEFELERMAEGLGEEPEA